MPRKVKADKVQKLTLMLGQAVAAMRVNEMLMCRLLRWAASQSDDPRRFLEEAVQNTRNELKRADRADGSATTAEATDEALEYLDDLAAEIGTANTQKPVRAGTKGFALLERLHFPTFTSASNQAGNGPSQPGRLR